MCQRILRIFFKKREQKPAAEIKSFLSHINIPKLSEEDLTKKDLYNSLETMTNFQVTMI